MTTSTSRMLARLSSRVQTSAFKLNKQCASMGSGRSVESLFIKSTTSVSVRRFSIISRLPVELGSMETMLPLHSAIASARLTSSLPMDSQAWGIVPQGISMPL